MSAAAPPTFADGKDPEALRTIGEVAKALGIRQHVLRYWEEQFPMLKPLKRSGGRRYYRSEDVRMVEAIDRLVHKEGYTLKGAKQALQGRTSSTPLAPSAPVAQPAASGAPINSNFAYRARLISLRTTLVNALHDA
ncbi:MAG: MerR family transcriptional regulator [Sphingomonadales bacterium]|nr:MerR family transcriptional regulator [Sphingomonadaceae bacterium]MBS3930941.1 MerR family transcriptional regulator [Sphingomonadales bacterium]